MIGNIGPNPLFVPQPELIINDPQQLANVQELLPGQRAKILEAIHYWLESFSEVETPCPHPNLEVRRTMTKKEQQEEFLGVIKEYSSQNLVEVFEIATPVITEYEQHLSGSRGFEVKTHFLKELQTMLPEQRQEALSKAQEELRAMSVDEIKFYRLSSYMSYPQAVPLFRGLSLEQFMKLKDTLRHFKFDEDKGELRINTVVPLLQDCKDINLVTAALWSYNDQKFLQTIEFAQPQLLGLSSSHEVIILADAMRKEMMAVAEPLLPQCIDVAEKVFVYKSLAKHPEAIAEVIEGIPGTLAFLRSNAIDSPVHKEMASGILATSLPANRDTIQDFIAKIIPLFKQENKYLLIKYVPIRGNVAKLFDSIPLDCQTKFAEGLFSLLLQTCHELPTRSVLELFSLASGNQALELLDLLQNKPYIRPFAIYTVRSIPSEACRKLTLFIQAAPFWPSHGTGGDQWTGIGTSVMSLFNCTPLEEAESCLTALLRLKECVTQVDFLRNGAQLRFNSVSINRIAAILESITSLPLRGATLELLTLAKDNIRLYEELLQFIPESERRAEILGLILNLEVSEAERQDVLRNLLPTLPQEQTSDAQYTHLRAMLLGLQEQIVRDAYSLSVDRKDLQSQPLKLLAELAEQFLQHNANFLRVTFKNEEGIDVGGPGRAYITGLIDGLKEALQFTKQKAGLYLPMEYKQEHAQSFEQLGMLFMFVLNAAREYPIGMVFDYGFFQALAKVKENPTFSELVELYCLMTNNEELKLYAKPFTAQTDEKILTRALAFAMLEDEFKGKDLKEHHAALYTALQAIINNEFLMSLKPLLAIAKGMQKARFTKVTWQDVQKLTPATLSASLQGRLTNELVLSKLKFHPSISKEQQVLIRNWVKTADLQQLASFVYGITGAKALGNTDLNIHAAPSDVPSFSTCFFKASLPISEVYDQEAMNAVINNALLGIEGDKFNRC